MENYSIVFCLAFLTALVTAHGSSSKKSEGESEASVELALTCLPMVRGVDGLDGEARPLMPLSARSSDRSLENAAAAR